MNFTTPTLIADAEAERGVLGAILVDESHCTDAFTRLKPAHFHHKTRKGIFEAMTALWGKGVSIGIPSLGSGLLGGQNEARDEILSISADVVTTGGVEIFVQRVLDAYALRGLGLLGMQLAEKTTQGEPVQELLDAAAEEVYRLSMARSRQEFETSQQVMERNMANFDTTMDGKLIGVNTGFGVVDRYTRGLRPKKMYVVAGDAAMGKSVFALDVILHAARAGHLVAVFNLEMDNSEYGERALANIGTLESDKFSEPEYLRANKKELAAAAKTIANLPIFWDDSAEQTPARIVSRCKQLRMKYGRLDLVVVDYLQYMEPSTPQRSTPDAVREVSKGLKAAAKLLDTPILALSSLTIPAERKNKTPTMQDLRESKQIKFDAHAVVLLHRPGVYDSRIDPGKLLALMSKNRGGRTGEIDLFLELKHNRIRADYTGDQAQEVLW